MESIARVSCTVALLGLFLTTACTEEAAGPAPVAAFSASGPVIDAASAQSRLAAINADLASRGLAIARVELALAPTADPASPTLIIANDRTLRLTSRWVPDDTRRNADGDRLTFAHFDPFMIANGAGPASAAVNASFATWNGQTCSDLDLVQRFLAPGILPSVLIAVPGFINDPLAADVATIGFLPGFLFDLLLGPGASTTVLGVTATLVFIDIATGVPTDVNGDGRDDTAIKEIWYNNDFVWSTTGAGGVDVETVALHENGHALELDHFGRIAANLKKGTLTVSPRAVMNAVILGLLRTPTGTDAAAFCGNFASWPH